jgi:hypothetical protein
MKINLSKLILNLLIISKGVSGVFLVSGALSLALIFLSRYNKVKAKQLFFLLSVSPLFFYSALTNPGAAGLLSLLGLLILKPKLNLNKNAYPVVYFTLLLIITQFAYSIHQGDARPHMIGLEQNFSALSILILYLLVVSAHRIWFVLAGLLTLSRMFFFAILLREILIKFKWIGFGKILFYLLLIAILISFVLAQMWILNAPEYRGYEIGFGRLFVLNDSSNINRFIANGYYLDILTRNFGEYFFKGLSTSDYLSLRNLIDAHNSIIQLLFLYGMLPSLLYILVVIYYFSQSTSLRVAFASLFAASLVLQSVLSPLNIGLVYILLRPDLSAKGAARLVAA